MKQILVGNCIPGDRFTTWVPRLLDKGFECFTVNFHMTLGGLTFEALAPQVRALLEGTGIRVSALGFYCNALMNEDHERTLHHAIDMAQAFGTAECV